MKQLFKHTAIVATAVALTMGSAHAERLSGKDYKQNNLDLIHKFTGNPNVEFKNTRFEIVGMPTKDTVNSWQNHGSKNGTVKIFDSSLALTGNSFWQVTTSYDQCQRQVYAGMTQSQCDRGSVRNEVRHSSEISVSGKKELWTQFSFKPVNNLIHWELKDGKWANIGQCHSGTHLGDVFSINIQSGRLNAILQVPPSDPRADENSRVTYKLVPRAFAGPHLNAGPGQYGTTRWTTVRVQVIPGESVRVWVDGREWFYHKGALRRSSCYWKQGLYINGNTPETGTELSYETRNNQTIWFDGVAAGRTPEQLEENLTKEAKM